MYKIMKENETITYSGQEIIDVLKEIEVVMISLHKIGSYYAYTDKFTKKKRAEYEKDTTQFIDEWQVTEKLAQVRCILSKKLNNSLGDDDMDDLERATENLKYWTKPGDKP